jgi:hypothetical protein
MPRFEASYENFVGGLNTVSANEALGDVEFPELKNIELGDRGSLKRRHGMVLYHSPQVTGRGQGFFRLYRKDRVPLEVYAINGNLYTKGNDFIELNETLDWQYVSDGSDYKIVKVNVPNAKPNGTITLSDTSVYSVVSSITAKHQITLDSNKNILISLANAETGWTGTPTSDQMKEFAKTLKLGVTYELPQQKIDIQGLPNGFQTTRPIEAVQYRDKLYFATGTKLVEFDGVTAKVVEPYKPEPLEALYIGTNALADNPSDFMQDGTGENLRIDGVTATLRIGVINQKTTLKVYISKPPTMTSVEYRFLYRKVGATSWITGKDWSTDKTFDFVPNEVGDYEFDIYARPAGDTSAIPARFVVPKYTVKETNQNENVSFSAIHRCNRILLHWERLILYGDDLNSGHIFISHLRKPDYFPTPNTLFFESKEIEPLTALVRYRDMLVAFTPNSIQALYGKHPAEYTRVTLNTEIGCIAPYSAQVTGNVITFLSKDGVYVLESVGVIEERANVTKIDTKIDNIVDKDKDAFAIVHDSQYQLYFPSRKKRLRCYFEQGGAWTKDESEKLDFVCVREWDGEIFGQSLATGKIFKFDKNVWDDDGYVYESRIETKEYDFGKPYYKKKIKQIKLLFKTFDEPSNLNVYVYADNALIVDPKTSYPEVNENEEVVWVEKIEPNVRISAGTVLGEWIMGKDAFGYQKSQTVFIRASGRCKKTKLILSHTESAPNSLLGIGFVFTMTNDR